jgi:beta-lactamase superfamily II metal-dependent hydrolase
MLTIEMLGAEQGDALFISWGNPDKPKRMIIDSGVKKRPNVLSKRINELPADQREFELLVITHVDADHIVGVVPMLQHDQLGATFKDVWFNGFKHLSKDQVEPMGPVDGEELTFLLSQRDWNKAFKGRAVAVPSTGKLPSRKLAGGLRVTVVGPTATELLDLVPVWEAEVKKAGIVAGKGRKPTPPEDTGLEPLGPGDVPDVKALAEAPFKADDAEANGSSIVVLIEDKDGASALLCGDAFPATVRSGVERLLAERGGSKLKLSVFKPPHHGSRFNLDLPLMRKIDAKDFLFSSNGRQTKHPHSESVARVLHTTKKPTLWFNYETAFNDMWKPPATQKKLGYSAQFGDGRMTVDVKPR